MRAQYDIQNTTVHSDSPIDGFLLAQKNGSYYLHTSSYTRYSGFHVVEKQGSSWELYKLLDSLIFDKPIEFVKQYPTHTLLSGSDFTIHIQLLAKQTMTLRVCGNVHITFRCDFRPIHDFDTHGRIYRTSFDETGVTISYEKHLSDDVLSPVSHWMGKPHAKTLFIKSSCALSDSTCTLKQHWVCVDYPYESIRNSSPHSLYVYDACTIDVRDSTLLLSTDSDIDFEVVPHLARAWESYVHATTPLALSDSFSSSVFTICARSFDTLITSVSGEGIYAGLPWFYQYWARDELISVGGLFALDRYEQALPILQKYQQLLGDGRIPNRFPHSELGSADAIGLLAKRYCDILTKKPQLLSIASWLSIRDFFIESLELQLSVYEKNGLVFNTAKETWMDTDQTITGAQDTRSGARIEIQAYTLCIYKLIHEIGVYCKDDAYEHFAELERTFAQRVSHVFFNEQSHRLVDGIELDGSVDLTIRPNVFLAYYAYPDLLSKQQWVSTFEQTLPALLLPWGGLSSIDCASPLFCPHHTGQTNESYHRGDSWFYINNIASLCLLTVSSRFTDVARRIVRSSIHELLESGIMGYCAEISDAHELHSKGCFAQSWSHATLLEVLAYCAQKKIRLDDLH
jgi:hypothetical protein